MPTPAARASHRPRRVREAEGCPGGTWVPMPRSRLVRRPSMRNSARGMRRASSTKTQGLLIGSRRPRKTTLGRAASSPRSALSNGFGRRDRTRIVDAVRGLDPRRREHRRSRRDHRGNASVRVCRARAGPATSDRTPPSRQAARRFQVSGASLIFAWSSGAFGSRTHTTSGTLGRTSSTGRNFGR